MNIILPYEKNLKELSKQLRENMTDAERHLWVKIRRRQIKGHQFFRQKPIGEYIADFYSKSARLVIEVDGGQHFTDEKIKYDRTRDEYMTSLGLRVLRFNNAEVLTNIEGVVERIGVEISLSWERKSPLMGAE
jgi:very-short-patch-repair endonuclease